MKRKANQRFERDFCYAAAPQKPLKRAVGHGAAKIFLKY